MIWNITSSTGSSDPVFSGGGRTRALMVVRRQGSRGMRLSVDPRNGAVRLTLAVRAPLRPALAWATSKRAWVEAELARLPVPVPIVPDLVFAVDDRPVAIIWDANAPRLPLLHDDRLIVGGPLDTLSPRVLRFLRRHALIRMTAETHELAAAHDIVVTHVAVGDPRSRWGSCATSGAIRYSWRLILAPRFVRHATIAHEVAHRVHMNHGPAFHRLAADLYGHDPVPARTWLRAHGAALHWFGREG